MLNFSDALLVDLCKSPPSNFLQVKSSETLTRSQSERRLLCLVEETVTDSSVSRWLEKEFPDSPSLFVPDVETSKVTPASLKLAKNYFKYVNSTFGSPALLGTPFSPFFSSIANGILGLIKEDKVSSGFLRLCELRKRYRNARQMIQDREYFTSDTKLGVKDGWNQLQKLDRGDYAVALSLA